MTKFDKSAFLAGANFPTLDVELADLGVLTIRKLSARQLDSYLEFATPSRNKKKKFSDMKLTMMLLQQSIVDKESGTLLFTEEEVDKMLEAFPGEQVTFLSNEVLIFNGMATRPKADSEKKS